MLTFTKHLEAPPGHDWRQTHFVNFSELGKKEEKKKKTKEKEKHSLNFFAKANAVLFSM